MSPLEPRRERRRSQPLHPGEKRSASKVSPASQAITPDIHLDLLTRKMSGDSQHPPHRLQWGGSASPLSSANIAEYLQSVDFNLYPGNDGPGCIDDEEGRKPLSTASRSRLFAAAPRTSCGALESRMPPDSQKVGTALKVANLDCSCSRCGLAFPLSTMYAPPPLDAIATCLEPVSVGDFKEAPSMPEKPREYYCLPCLVAKFSLSRCAHCGEHIFGSTRHEGAFVWILSGDMYHSQCFRCVHCGQMGATPSLINAAEIVIGDHGLPLCRSCFAQDSRAPSFYPQTQFEGQTNRNDLNGLHAIQPTPTFAHTRQANISPMHYSEMNNVPKDGPTLIRHDASSASQPATMTTEFAQRPRAGSLLSYPFAVPKRNHTSTVPRSRSLPDSSHESMIGVSGKSRLEGSPSTPDIPVSPSLKGSPGQGSSSSVPTEQAITAHRPRPEEGLPRSESSQAWRPIPEPLQQSSQETGVSAQRRWPFPSPPLPMVPPRAVHVHKPNPAGLDDLPEVSPSLSNPPSLMMSYRPQRGEWHPTGSLSEATTSTTIASPESSGRSLQHVSGTTGSPLPEEGGRRSSTAEVRYSSSPHRSRCGLLPLLGPQVGTEASEITSVGSAAGLHAQCFSSTCNRPIDGETPYVHASVNHEDTGQCNSALEHVARSKRTPAFDEASANPTINLRSPPQPPGAPSRMLPSRIPAPTAAVRREGLPSNSAFSGTGAIPKVSTPPVRQFKSTAGAAPPTRSALFGVRQGTAIGDRSLPQGQGKSNPASGLFRSTDRKPRHVYGGMTPCPLCQGLLTSLEGVPGPQGTRWHRACLVCTGTLPSGNPCRKPLDSGANIDSQGRPFCRDCLITASLVSRLQATSRA